MYNLTRIDADVDFGFFAWSRVYVAIGLPLLFIPVTTASYDGLAPGKTDQASALINVARNFGGSIGVSLAQTVLARREQFHQARLSEHVGAWNPAYQQSLQQFQSYFATKLLPGTSTSQTAVASIGQMVELQSSFLAYIDVFFVLMLVAGVVAILALTLRSVKPGGAVQGAA